MARKLQIAFPVPAEGAEQGYANYYNAFAALGAALIPVDAQSDPDAFDGMVLPGGADVDPVFYHRENIACGTLEPELDRLQLGALERFVQSGKPVLGICRGHQVLNVFFGGTLIQHLPVSIRHARGEGEHTDKVHDSRALPGSFLAALYGESFAVNSSHHQAVEQPGEGLELVQWSDDGVPEAMFHRTLPVWGVQWHPERMCFAHRREDTVDGSVLLKAFLRRCED